MSETSSITVVEPVEQATTAPTRDEEFWFADGTIILIVQDTEFRVYRGLLENRFPILKDLLTLPQPAAGPGDAELGAEGACPVVRLCDSARDWRNVFRLYMPKRDICFFGQGPSRPTFETLAACVHLGHKYDMAHIEHEALEYLKTILLESPLHRPTIPWPPQGFTASSAIGVVNLARLTGEHSLLPIALFRCCRLGAPDITEGCTYSDGEREILSSEDLGRCYLARAKLVKEMYGKFTRAFLAALDPGRRGERPCRINNNGCRAAAAIQRFFHAHQQPR